MKNGDRVRLKGQLRYIGTIVKEIPEREWTKVPRYDAQYSTNKAWDHIVDWDIKSTNSFWFNENELILIFDHNDILKGML